jgi:hypothetical protein
VSDEAENVYVYVNPADAGGFRARWFDCVASSKGRLN